MKSLSEVYLKYVAEEMKVKECKPGFGYHTRIWQEKKSKGH